MCTMSYGIPRFLLPSVFVLLSSYWGWWGTTFGWLARQTAAGLAVWLPPLIALVALVALVFCMLLQGDRVSARERRHQAPGQRRRIP